METNQGNPPPLNVLVACDGSDHSNKAVDFLASLIPTGAKVRLITVASNEFARYDGPWGPLSDERNRQDKLQAILDSAFSQPLNRLKKAGAKTETTYRLGNPVEEIQNEIDQWRPDLVVVGRFGTTGLAKLIIGSVSERLVKSSHVPVLVVP